VWRSLDNPSFASRRVSSGYLVKQSLHRRPISRSIMYGPPEKSRSSHFTAMYGSFVAMGLERIQDQLGPTTFLRGVSSCSHQRHRLNNGIVRNTPCDTQIMSEDAIYMLISWDQARTITQLPSRCTASKNVIARKQSIMNDIVSLERVVITLRS